MGDGWQLKGGTILGGTLASSGGDKLRVASPSTMDGVHVTGTVSIETFTTLKVQNGMELDGFLELHVLGAAAVFEGTQTLSGSGEVDFLSDSTIASVRPSMGTLTIGPDITVRGSYGTVGDDTQPLLVQGTVVSDTPGNLVLRGLNWTNEGLLSADGGDLNAGDVWSNEGTISCAAFDQLTTTSYTQTAAGTLRVELGGTDPADYGALTCNGPATVAGTLEVVLADGYTPTVGDAFVVLDGSGLTGSFTTLTLPPGLNWNVAQGPSDVIITVVP
jgi:hypothetical protein